MSRIFVCLIVCFAIGAVSLSAAADVPSEPTAGNLVTDIVCPAGSNEVSALVGRHRLVVGSDSTLSLLPGAQSAPVRLDGGTVILGARGSSDELDPTVTALNPLLWFDPSRAATLVALTNTEGVVQTHDGRTCIEQMLDVRGTSYYALNERRVWEDNPPRFIDAILKVYPNAVPDGPDAKTCLSFIGARKRLSIGTATAPFSARNVYAKFCVMVFGSAGGGGRALLATDDDSLSRTNKVASSDDPFVPLTNPVTTNTSVTVWLDGCRLADPSHSYFSGGWQIVSIDLTPCQKPVTGIGYSGTSSSVSAGGQEYAEIIFFDQVLGETDRVHVEDYLSRKWNVGLDRPYAPAAVYGTNGVVRLAGDASVRGGFAGTIDIGSHTLSLTDAKGTPTAAEVGALTGLVGWFDPDNVTKRVMQNATKPDEIRAIQDVRKTYEEGDVYLSYTGVSTYNRAPNVNRAARGWGVERTWMDFENYLSGDTVGNNLRFAVSNGGSVSDATLSARMAFIVSDSFRGGGSPVQDRINAYYEGNIRSRITDDPSSPIWASGSSAVVTGGNAYLNDEAVESPTTTGFTSQPEVFSFTTTASLGLACLGGFHNSNARTGQAEMLGESLFFNRVLGEAERTTVSAYLMWKWIGMLPEGYSELGDATVVGSGSVAVASAARLPKFGAGFSGLVEMADGSFAFSLTGRGFLAQVVNPIDLGSGTLRGNRTYDVACTLAERPSGGAYRLIAWAAEPANAVWNLSLTAPDGLPPCTLRAADDGLFLDVSKTGFTLIVK